MSGVTGIKPIPTAYQAGTLILSVIQEILFQLMLSPCPCSLWLFQIKLFY